MKLDYGKEGLEVDLNPKWNVTILKPSKQEIIKHPIVKIRRALRRPLKNIGLHKIIEQKKFVNKVCIVVSDATRPVPSRLMLEAIIKDLNSYGVGNEKIIVLIATGLHRPSREEEKERIIGKNLKSNIKIIDHIAKDKDSMVYLGEASDGVPIYINKHYYKSDLKIITGYVEPHFFYGFSGGRKSIVPGIAGVETIQGNHSAEFIDSPHSRFGTFKKNLIHKNGIEITRKVGVDFAVNVCINEKHLITKVATGDFEAVHEKLVNYQLKNVFKEISKPFDIVVCGNGGYPLDLNLYQAVKSMAIGEMGVKKGGTIISVNECSEGIGIGQDKFKKLLFSGLEPSILYKKILNREIIFPDQWEIQILTRVLLKAEVFVVSRLREDELGNIGLKYALNVEEAINKALEKHGKDAHILILPSGPQILPLLKT
ncbi:MAG: nickel-dependent lactate racemase [Promethearchaeota archaeon]